MKKCDVVIPVYKSPEWVKLCIYSLFCNTEKKDIGTVYLINDCDDELTENCLNNLANKYSQIKVLKNEKNLGFVKTTNRGMKEAMSGNSDFVLLLNTDCILSKNAITKMMDACNKNDKIGLICPISSNAANLTLEMFEGFSFMDMNRLLEEKFSGKLFDACTVVGNCLMITRKCIEKTGYLDESYGMGYGEETDYQFKAMSNGFEAKVIIDTYVFHKSEASFGSSKEKQERQAKNAKLFFDRWGSEYYSLMEKYQKNDPIQYILSHISDKDKRIKLDFLIYLIGFSQTAGGIHMATDMINYMTINGCPCNIIYSWFDEKSYNEILLFHPIHIDHLDKFQFNALVSTFNTTTYFMKSFSNKYNVPLIYFAQGYESYFYNGREYGIVELSYKLADKILTISNYLKEKYFDMFHVQSDVISNGINYDLLHRENKNKRAKILTFMLRNDTLKGDFLLLDVIRVLMNQCRDIVINVLYNAEEVYFPKCDNKSIELNLYHGPFERKEIAGILQKSDIFVDASLTEGFGLMALEAMTAGNVCVVSDSGGIHEYMKDGINGFIVSDVLNINSYVDKIITLLENEKTYECMKQQIDKMISNYDYDFVCKKYIKFFQKKIEKKNLSLDDYDSELYDQVLGKKFRAVDDSTIDNNKKSKVTRKVLYKICKIIPKRVRIRIKNGVAKLYHFTNER